MKKWVTIWGLLLVCSMAAGLTGCTAGAQTAENEQTESSVEESSAAENEREEAEEMTGQGEASATDNAGNGREEAEEIPDLEAGIYEINKYGNIILTVGQDSMTELGYQPGDVILVRIGEGEMEMPIGTSYSDVDYGEPVCCYKTSSSGVDVVVLAVNSGNLAEEMGIAEKITVDAEPGYEWVFSDGLDESAAVNISMKQKQGYAAEYSMHQLGSVRTNNREDYPDLSDAEYANFRAVETTGMGKGNLFRSSSPVDPSLNRNAEADEALLKSMVQTVMNLADSDAAMRKYPDYALSSYASCNIIALNMSMDLKAEDSENKLAEGYRFFTAHEGPYLIHCKEGKDRTGFAAAILECLMGADPEEIEADYMLTYHNYYGVEPGSEQYDQIVSDNIDASLADVFGISSIREEGADLQACAEAYLKKIGMNEDEIVLLKENLSKDYGE